MKGGQIMKTMKMIFVELILLVLPFATLNAQFASRSYGQSAYSQQTEVKQYEFQTTSSLVGSGSSLPNAAQSGVVMSGNAPGENYSASYTPSGRRRIGGSGSGNEGNEAEENEDPQETPIGDGMWVLLFLAMAYAIYTVRVRRVREEV